MLNAVIAMVVIGGSVWLLVWVFRLAAQQERSRDEEELVISQAFAQENGFRPLATDALVAFHDHLEAYAGPGKLDTSGGAKTVFRSSRRPDIIAVYERQRPSGPQYLIEQRGIRAQQGGDRLVWTAVLTKNTGNSGEMLLLPKSNVFSAHKPRHGHWEGHAITGLEGRYGCFVNHDNAIDVGCLPPLDNLSELTPAPGIHVRDGGILVFYELPNQRPETKAAYTELLNLAEELHHALAS